MENLAKSLTGLPLLAFNPFIVFKKVKKKKGLKRLLKKVGWKVFIQFVDYTEQAVSYNFDQFSYQFDGQQVPQTVQNDKLSHTEILLLLV